MPLIARTIVDDVIGDAAQAAVAVAAAARRSSRSRSSGWPTCAASTTAGRRSPCSTTCATSCTTTCSPSTSAPCRSLDRPAGRPRQQRHHADPGPAQLPAADVRQPAADADVAGHHVLALAAAGLHRPGHRAGAVRGLLPAADQGLPRQLGRPAARGRGRRDRRRGRRAASAWSRRSARRSASCTGWSASSQTLYGSRMRATRLQARYQPLLEAIPTLAQVAVLALGGWLAHAGRDHARHLPGVLDVRRPVRRPGPPARRRPHHRPAGPRRRRADLPGARPRDRDRGRARRRRAARAARARSSSATCTSGTTRQQVLRGLDLHVGRGRAGRPRRRQRQRQVDGRRRWSSGCSTRTRGQVLVDGYDVRDVTPALAAGPDRGGVRGELPVLRHHRRQHRLRPTRTRPARRSRPRPASRAPTTSSASCPTATTPGSASAVSASPAASGSASPSPARCSSDPRILVLDDATSAVDASTEETIFTGLREVLAGRTSLIVAHRVSTLHLADRVVLLERRPGRRRRHARRADGPQRGVPRAAHRPRRRRRRPRSATRSRRSPSSSVTPDGLAERQPAPTPYARPTTRPSRASRPADGEPRSRGAGTAAAGGWPSPRPPSCSPASRRCHPSATSFVPRPATKRVRAERDPASFSMPAPVCVGQEFRWPFALGSAARRARRGRRRSPARGWSSGIDHGVAGGAPARCCGRPRRRSCVVVLADLLDQVAETFVTGRTSERVMAVAADPDLGPAPAPVARLLRARDGRPDHDPDDHRRRPVRDADRERPAARRWSRW